MNNRIIFNCPDCQLEMKFDEKTFLAKSKEFWDCYECEKWTITNGKNSNEGKWNVIKWKGSFKDSVGGVIFSVWGNSIEECIRKTKLMAFE